MRGVRFACEAPRTGWNGTKGQKTTSDPADLAKSAKFLSSCSAPPRGPGGPGIARARRDLPNADSIFQITPVCRSRCGTRGRSAAPAPGGSYVVWDHSPCVWFCLCRPIEGYFQPLFGISSGVDVWRVDVRPVDVRPVCCLGSLRLCVVLLVHTDRKDISDRCLGSAAE